MTDTVSRACGSTPTSWISIAPSSGARGFRSTYRRNRLACSRCWSPTRPSLVPRDVLRQRIWGSASVEWETGLHQAISRIRTTLGDSATDPRFIETVPRRGYRFIGRLRSDRRDPLVSDALPPAEVPRTGRSPKIVYGGIVVVLVGVAALALSIPTALQQHRDVVTTSDVLAPSPADLRDAEAIRLYEEASHLVRQGDFEAAIERFERAAARAPDWAEPWSARAEAELAHPAVGRVERARLALEGALARDASNARAWRQMAQLRLWEEWDWLGGEQALERAAALEPTSADLWQLRAAIEIVHGRFDEAVVAALRAVALDPVSTGLRVDLGWTLYYAGDIGGATAECRRSLELDPANPSAFQCLVQALLVEGRNDELATLVAERAISPASARSGEARSTTTSAATSPTSMPNRAAGRQPRRRRWQGSRSGIRTAPGCAG